MHSQSFVSSVLAGLLFSSNLVNAHTWIEQLMVIAPNGTMVGEPGFPRGNVLRSDPSFGDPAMVNLIPPGGRTINVIEPTDLMCRSSQTSQTQTNGSPRLQAAPGSAVALRFQENGHVTLPQGQPGKPANRGTVFVYGTTQPSPDDSFLAIHRVWNAAGTGGDGRGVLLSTQNFDDGQCYQVNGGSISVQRQAQFPHENSPLMGGDIWCQQDIALPANAPTGQPYTLYWVWDWPTLPGTPGFPEGKQEIYTTCMDVDIVEDNSDGIQPVLKSNINFAQSQDLNVKAIASQLADISNPTAVNGDFIPFDATATGPAIGQAATESASANNSPDSTVPAFLSVHTTSTGGPGLETGVSVVPIGQETVTSIPSDFTATAAAGQQTVPAQQTGGNGRGNGRGGRGGNRGGRGGGGGGGGQTAVTAAPEAPAATGTAIVVNNPGVETFTEFDSITETVFQTVYNTRFTKRDADVTAPPIAIHTVAASIPCSKTESVYRLRARLPFFAFRFGEQAIQTDGC